MAIEFTVNLENRPGALAALGGALGDANVNIDAIMATVCEGQGMIQFVANEPEQAAKVLEKAGIAYTRREVLIVKVMDEPGTLGDVALVMAHAQINIDALYITMTGQMVMGVDDLHGALQVVHGMDVVG